MGQRSLTFLNKAGLYLFWDSIWEDTTNYKRFLKYSYFFNKFFFLFFSDNLFFRVYSGATSTNETSRSAFSSTVIDSNFFLKNLNIYFGKIWFLKYGGWCIFIINMYNSNFLKKEKKSNNFLKKKNFTFLKVASLFYLKFFKSNSYKFFLKNLYNV